MFCKVKRMLAILLALLILAGALSLVSCESDGEGEDTSADLPGEEVTEAPIFLGEFEITPDVRIIYPDKADDTVKKAAKLIAQAILDKYGITLKVSSDWNYAQGPEILLGNCTYRESAVAFTEKFYVNGYGYSVLSTTEIGISAFNTDNVYRAANLFIDELIGKTAEPRFDVGTEYLRNNEKPKTDYTLNGVKLEEYTIVADSVDNPQALYLANEIGKNLYADLPIVATADFKGGHAIKIGSFGTSSMGSIRYALSSENVGGVSTIYVDGETEILREKAAEFLFEKYMTTKLSVAKFEVPAKIYKYKWASNVSHTGLYVNKLVETRELADGVTYFRFNYNNSKDDNVDVYAIVVEGSSKAEFRVWAGDLSTIDDGKEVMDVKTVGAQAKELEKTTGENVLAAVNAAYFRKSEGSNYPYTMRIVQGRVLCPPLIVTGTSLRPDDWMGITYDGQLVCGDKASYESTWQGKLEYAVAMGVHMMIDGKVNFSKGAIDVNPLTAVGTTADGGFVLLCADGRSGASAGATSADMLGMMLDLIAYYPNLEYKNVYTLDGGGSTEMVLESGNTFKTMNVPSDGKSRPVGDIIAVVIPND